jgi:hypothetical protein
MLNVKSHKGKGKVSWTKHAKLKRKRKKKAAKEQQKRLLVAGSTASGGRRKDHLSFLIMTSYLL